MDLLCRSALSNTLCRLISLSSDLEYIHAPILDFGLSAVHLCAPCLLLSVNLGCQFLPTTSQEVLHGVGVDGCLPLSSRRVRKNEEKQRKKEEKQKKTEKRGKIPPTHLHQPIKNLPKPQKTAL